MLQTEPKARLEVRHELYRRGVLVWKLTKSQKDLYNLFHKSNFRIQTWLISRRYGKTHSLSVLAIEQCLKVPGSIVKFLSPTRLQVRNNLRPLIRQILEDCPEDIKPEFKAKDDIYYFPNGSEIQLAGSDGGHAEKLRGGFAHICIVDEAGDVDDLDYIVKSILLPTTLTTNGKVLIAGTPPKTADHDFIKYIEEAEHRGSLIKRIVYDNTLLTKEQIDDLILEMGGKDSESTRRELFCEIIKDPSSAVIPEFTKVLEERIVKEWPRPPFFDTYESMDLGAVDLTGVLFAYFDFRAAKLIIEDEFVIKGNEKDFLPKLTATILKKEEELWTNPLSKEIKRPEIRVSDINYIVTNEICRASGYKVNFTAARKDDKIAAVNNLRMMLSNGQIIIHPRCENLIRHLRNVKWAGKSKETFARSPDDGHYDLVDALIYLIRSIAYNKNPYPTHYQINLQDLHIQNPKEFMQALGSRGPAEVYKQIFNIKSKPRRIF